jgi:medium-chain acyl-[acyl-carrier-protein] hydrolase
MPDGVEVVVLVMPGRDPRTRVAGIDPPGALVDVVGPAVEAVRDLQAADPMPFAVFGHSMGALVAFELTTALEALSEHTPSPRPDRLFVSGRRAPDEIHEGNTIRQLPDEEFIDAMQRRYGGIPDAVRNEPELMALFLPGLRADVSIYETYAPLTDRLVQCPVRVYGGVEDRQPRPEDLRGWQRVAARPISTRVFPGGHFYLQDAREALTADLVASWNQGADVVIGVQGQA